jgi:hypothetical protein
MPICQEFSFFVNGARVYPIIKILILLIIRQRNSINFKFVWIMIANYFCF